MSSNAAISVRLGDVSSPSTYWVMPLASDGDERHSAIYMLEKVGANEYGELGDNGDKEMINQSIW